MEAAAMRMSCSESPDTLFKISTKTRNSYSLYWNKMEQTKLNSSRTSCRQCPNRTVLFNFQRRSSLQRGSTDCVAPKSWIPSIPGQYKFKNQAVRVSLRFRFSSSCFFWCNHTIMIIPIRIIVPIKIAINFFVKSFILLIYLRENQRMVIFDRNWQLINLSQIGQVMTVFYFAFEYARFINRMPK